MPSGLLATARWHSRWDRCSRDVLELGDDPRPTTHDPRRNRRDAVKWCPDILELTCGEPDHTIRFTVSAGPQIPELIDQARFRIRQDIAEQDPIVALHDPAAYVEQPHAAAKYQCTADHLQASRPADHPTPSMTSRTLRVRDQPAEALQSRLDQPPRNSSTASINMANAGSSA